MWNYNLCGDLYIWSYMMLHPCIVLSIMFTRWFFANSKTNITSTALKLCSPIEDVMS